MRFCTSAISVAVAAVLSSTAVLAGGENSTNESMAYGLDGYTVTAPLLTIGETFYYTGGDLNPTTAGAYTPPGILDGLGAYELDDDTVRVFANHELTFGDGYPYEVSDGNGGTFSMTGTRVSYFDIDKFSKTIVDAGLAYNLIYDANGNVATDTSFLPADQEGFGLTRFCSAVLVDPLEFGGRKDYDDEDDWEDRKGRGTSGRGIVDRIFFTGEETGGRFSGTGGAEWALDVETGALWAVPAMGRGAWENVTQIDTGSKRKVAFILADDSSPFDFDGDGEKEAAPLYLYMGTKEKGGNFLERNGLSGGKLYVFVPRDPEMISPVEFNTEGTLKGSWVEIDNTPDPEKASNDGSTGYDEYGYPTQGTLWLRAKELNAFQFSRPEDVATNPDDGSEAVLASTGREFDFGGADTYGTIYTITTDFRKMKAKLRILYDGDADPEGTLRSPDNLDWADDGMIYVQEDKAVSTETYVARNSAESGIVRLDPETETGSPVRVAEIDRSVVLDASIPVWTDAVDEAPDEVGKPESSGILDVSVLFGEPEGSLYLFDIQNHGIDDQERYNADSRIIDEDLKEGGQLLFLRKKDSESDEHEDYEDD